MLTLNTSILRLYLTLSLLYSYRGNSSTKQRLILDKVGNRDSGLGGMFYL